jgi:UDP-glucose 4-epimerase
MKLDGLRILVTGSSGTIGNCLCENLLEKGVDLEGADIKYQNRWNGEVHYRTTHVDLRNVNDLKRLPTDVDVIVHFAANARVYNLVKDPDLAKDNFMMLYNVLEFARKNNIKKILFSSSREVYGNSGHILHSEDEALVKDCESPYTATKVAGEALIHSYQQCYGIEFIITRFSNVFGKFDYSDRVIPLFILKAWRNEDIHIYGEDKILDFTYVEDTVDGVVKALECFEISKNEVYNIATQKGYAIQDVARVIKGLLNSKSNLYCKANRAGEVCRFIADISKARAVLKYEPKFTLEEGLAKTVDWYLPRIEEYKRELQRNI